MVSQVIKINAKQRQESNKRARHGDESTPSGGQESSTKIKEEGEGSASATATATAPTAATAAASAAATTAPVTAPIVDDAATKHLPPHLAACIRMGMRYYPTFADVSPADAQGQGYVEKNNCRRQSLFPPTAEEAQVQGLANPRYFSVHCYPVLFNSILPYLTTLLPYYLTLT